MNCNHWLKDQCPINCPYFGNKAESKPECQYYPCRDVYSKGGDEMACGECEPTGCLNDKCNDWSPAEPDWSNCENLYPEEIKKCAFYLNDPNFEWVKVDKRNKNTYQTGFHDGYSKGKEAGLQQNKSGCACRFDNDGETILELCKAYSRYFADFYTHAPRPERLQRHLGS